MDINPVPPTKMSVSNALSILRQVESRLPQTVRDVSIAAYRALLVVYGIVDCIRFRSGHPSAFLDGPDYKECAGEDPHSPICNGVRATEESVSDDGPCGVVCRAGVIVDTGTNQTGKRGVAREFVVKEFLRAG